jgi:hypothetical protein
MRSGRLLRRPIALPGDHGSWVFLFSPLLIGLFAGQRWTTASLYLIVAALAGFLIRQPLTVAVKAYSGRRSRDDLPAAWFWTGIYAAIGLLHVTGLTLRGFGYVLYLALPGVPIFLWYLQLVRRREERRQLSLELLATGALGLVAPGAMWVGLGHPDPRGWLLWGLVWVQTVASILHAYLRLGQRSLGPEPGAAFLLRLAAAPLAVTTFNLVLVAALGLSGLLPRWLFLAYAVQWVETCLGTLRPARGARPRAIGMRQLAASTIFTLLFILLWRG